MGNSHEENWAERRLQQEMESGRLGLEAAHMQAPIQIPPGGGGDSGIRRLPTITELAQELLEIEARMTTALTDKDNAKKKLDEATAYYQEWVNTVTKLGLRRNSLLKDLAQYQLTEYEEDR